MIQNRTNFGWEWGRIWKNKRMVFLSTKSLPYAPQCWGHFAAWEWYPCQGDAWLSLEWKFPMLQTLLCWEWVQCPGTGALGLSLLKIPWRKSWRQPGHAPCPRNHNSGEFMQPSSCLKAEKGTNTADMCDPACKLQSAVPDTWQSLGIPNLYIPALQLKKQNKEWSSASLPPSALPLALFWHKCHSAVWWSRLGSWSSWELAWDFGTT